MSWYHDKKVVPIMPVIVTLKGNVRLAVCEGTWKHLGPTESWEDYFIYQRGNYSGVLWSEDVMDKKNTSEKKIHKVLSSNGRTFYNVIQVGNSYVCNCTGFSYRRNCRHCDSIRKGENV